MEGGWGRDNYIPIFDVFLTYFICIEINALVSVQNLIWRTTRVFDKFSRMASFCCCRKNVAFEREKF